MLKFFLGVFLTFIGTMIIIKTETVLSAFGRIDFFDNYLGTEGGSRLGYKIIGMGFVFIGVLIMTGLIDGFMMWALSPLLMFK